MAFLWIRKDVAKAIHQRQIAEHGGQSGIRDEGLLESALARPENVLAYAETPPDVAALAAAYAFGITRNHPFIDGNKRVSLVVTRTFLLLNGFDLKADQGEKYLIFLQLAENSITEPELAEWIRGRLFPSMKELK